MDGEKSPVSLRPLDVVISIRGWVGYPMSLNQFICTREPDDTKRGCICLGINIEYEKSWIV